MKETIMEMEEEGLPAVMMADERIHADSRLPYIPEIKQRG